ncbi:Oxidoreductase [Turnera subulata]|uniref:Mitochondrial intermembrane space import and assembly protein 40 homolog n=1 Tax=Turnera subulata TaxID=218843 RepID=A0A9Q0F737_9ROSI|nr:Oxidoreductase [Turnera subulata]
MWTQQRREEMGEAQSEGAAPDDGNQSQQSPTNSLQSLIAEAAAYGNDENEGIEANAEKALECPCISDLRNGSCGLQFSEAFLCFLKSTADEKGSDCVRPFVALQDCIKSNPSAFSKEEEMVEEGESKNGEGEEEEEAALDYKIIPPLWSRDSPPARKSKL